VPVAPSLCVTPMPPRITRKSTRPRASDRPMVDTVQPHGLLSFTNRSASSLLVKMQPLRWNNAKPIPGHDPRPAPSTTERGLDVAEISPPSGRGRSIFLTSTFYRSRPLHSKWVLSEIGTLNYLAPVEIAWVLVFVPQSSGDLLHQTAASGSRGSHLQQAGISIA